jgi:hypothetical protein
MKLFFHPNIRVIDAAMLAMQQGMELSQDGKGNLTVRQKQKPDAKIFTLRVKGAPEIKEVRDALKRSKLKMKADYALSQKAIVICLKNIITITREKK